MIEEDADLCREHRVGGDAILPRARSIKEIAHKFARKSKLRGDKIGKPTRELEPEANIRCEDDWRSQASVDHRAASPAMKKEIARREHLLFDPFETDRKVECSAVLKTVGGSDRCGSSEVEVRRRSRKRLG